MRRCQNARYRHKFQRELQTFPAFFDGLLPEEAQRGGAARALGIALQNSFALLAALGGDVAGALSLVPQSEVGAHIGARELSPRLSEGAALSAADLAALVVDLPQRPMLAGIEGRPRLSLAGAQPKLPLVRLASGGLRVPLSLDGGTEASTHILKPEPAALPGLVANEALIMRLASDIGLSVAHVDVVQAGERPCLLVTRYDRTAAGMRLHQEDFAKGSVLCPSINMIPGCAIFSVLFGRTLARSRGMCSHCST